jgi:hypothetical protein
MTLRSSARPKSSFRPEVERSESRFLLSAGGLAHTDVAKPAVVKDWYAYYINGRIDHPPTTTIYSLLVTNDTGDNLSVSLDANKTLVRNFRNNESLPSGDDILLFTDDAAGKFTLDMTGAGARGKFAFKATKGNKTSISGGYVFSPTPNWYATDSGLSNQFKVQITGTGVDKRVTINPPL